jgi:hypothetical protein
MSIQDIPELAIALRLCAASYADNVPQVIAEQFPGFQLVFNGTETSDGNYALIVIAPDNSYYLAVRGSLPFTNPPTWAEFYNWVVEDLNVAEQHQWGPPVLGGAVVSEGSWIAFNQLNTMVNLESGVSTISPILSTAVSNNRRVIITGHSLGGNMANTFASYFASQLQTASLSTENVYLFTFAAPGSGNKGFANSVDNNYPGDHSRHYELFDDIVPKCPVLVNVLNLSEKFTPPPAPFAPDISYDYLTLADAIIALAAIIETSYGANQTNAYAQVTNNYEVLHLPLLSQYMNQDSIEDWGYQALYQHGLAQYSKAIEGPPVDDLKAYTTKYKAAFDPF